MQPGTRLGHYEILEAIGKGGMGEVWRAKDTTLGRDVAIKTLPPEFAQDADRLARFEREAKLLASLNHPNIAAIHGFEHDQETHFLIMELVAGDTLAAQIQRGPIPVEESLKLALQIADALKAAHEKGVIHRDLKPANVKVTDDGKVKVLDFGLAKAFEGEIGDVNLSNSPTLSMQATQQGVILGTVAYMSPEQAKGRAVDKQTDVWALGAVLYEMLTGRQAFKGDEVSEILASVLAREPDYAVLQANLSSRIQRLLRRCLEKEPKKRWQDAGDVRIEIAELLADPAGVLAEPVGGVVHAAPPSRLRWVVAVVLAGIAAGIGTWVFRPLPEPPVIRFDDVLPEDRGFRIAARSVIAMSPDGSRFVYNATGGLYLRSMAEPEAQLIPGTEEALSNPTFSPDGQWLAFWSLQDRQLKKIAVVGGTAIPLAGVENNPGGISWDADDTILFSQAEGTSSVSADGGEPQLVVGQEEEGRGSYAHLLPDGNTVLSNVGGGPDAIGGEIGVYSLDSGESKLLFPGSRPRYINTGHIVYTQADVLFAVPFDLDRLEVTGGAVPLVQGVQPAPSQYSVSDSGALVYVTGSSSSDSSEGVLALIDRDGEVTALSPPPRSYRHPRISPDGTQIVVEIVEEEQSSIWVYDLSSGGALRRLTQPGEGTNTRPIWQLDGESITFASDRDGTWRVYSRVSNGSQVAEALTESEEDAIYLPESWSPGEILSLARLDGNFDAQWDLWTLSPGDEGVPQPFLELSGSDEFGSVFSADGRWVAYASTQLAAQGQGSGIYVRPFPLTETSFTITQTDGAWPVWSGDGAELFYRRRLVGQGASGAGVLNGVEVVFEPAPTFGEELQLPIEGFRVNLDYRDYDLSPDGERFLMIVPTDRAGSDEQPSQPTIRVVQNWFQELKERVPVPW